MATFDVYNLQKEKVGAIDLSDKVFAVEVKEHLLWETVRWQLEKRRRGTASTKTRSEVRGGGAKPYRQKGTGRARRGSSRSPLIRGGGVIFGPRPKEWGFNLPKKVRAGALRSALSLKVKESSLLIVRDFTVETHKTKEIAVLLERLGAGAALIIEGENRNLWLGARNLPRVKILPPGGVNVYDLLRHPVVVMTEACAKQVEERLS